MMEVTVTVTDEMKPIFADPDAQLRGREGPTSAGATWPVALEFEVFSLCLFQPVIRANLVDVASGEVVAGQDSHQAQWFFGWLPRGIYEFVVHVRKPTRPGAYRLLLSWGAPAQVREPEVELALRVGGDVAGNTASAPWGWEMLPGTAARIAALPWQQRFENWFFRHFDHAATVIGEDFLANSPALGGRVLDIGAGDGITDLGIFLRHRPQELVALDIVDYARSLPEVARNHGLPLDAHPPGMTFVQASVEEIPYAADYFDVVISWGSVEHIKGGYHKALDEVWRVLKPGGLFFVNPGLYYSAHGSHLGEFFPQPHHHLRMDEATLRDKVLSSEPQRMDRAGFDAPPAEYWRFYTELNRIRVAEFEAELKAYGYRVIRAALRVADRVDYSDELQGYSILDLAIEDAFFVLMKPGLAQ